MTHCHEKGEMSRICRKLGDRRYILSVYGEIKFFISLLMLLFVMVRVRLVLNSIYMYVLTCLKILLTHVFILTGCKDMA